MKFRTRMYVIAAVVICLVGFAIVKSHQVQKRPDERWNIENREITPQQDQAIQACTPGVYYGCGSCASGQGFKLCNQDGKTYDECRCP